MPVLAPCRVVFVVPGFKEKAIVRVDVLVGDAESPEEAGRRFVPENASFLGSRFLRPEEDNEDV